MSRDKITLSDWLHPDTGRRGVLKDDGSQFPIFECDWDNNNGWRAQVTMLEQLKALGWVKMGDHV